MNLNQNAALNYFIDRETAGYEVVHVRRLRCPKCGAVVTGRPQHSDRVEGSSVTIQRRRCQACGMMFKAILS